MEAEHLGEGALKLPFFSHSIKHSKNLFMQNKLSNFQFK